MKQQTKQTVKRSFMATIPVLTGYVVLGMGFGLLMDRSGYGVWWSLAMSLFLYAGSMQYAAVGLMTGGASLLTVALTTLAVNARHLFYGLSMVEPYQNAGAKKPYLIFALTDETYSLVCHSDKGPTYAFFVSVLNQLYWIAGTVVGSLLGRVTSFSTKGLEFSLTALFLTVFTDQWLSAEDHVPAAAGVGMTLICLLVFGPDAFWIPSMLSMAAVLLLRMRKEGAR